MKPKPKRKPRKARSAEKLLAAIGRHSVELWEDGPQDVGGPVCWAARSWPTGGAQGHAETGKTPREALSRLLDKLEAKR